MPADKKQIRIFISSPGDVVEERERARNVVHQLRRRYAGRLDLQAILWEELPLQADISFQQGIDLILSESGIDIAVFVLWSRLGSPLGPLVTNEEGRQYRSGTEREWDLMLKAREQSARTDKNPRPAILVYTRADDVSFEERLRGLADAEKASAIDQKLSVNKFISEEFHDSKTGTNVRAYHGFDQPTTFAQQLRVHLTGLLDPIAGEHAAEPVWDIAEQGPPFRGLDVFEFEHAPIFFGREDEIVSVRNQLREQACNGCAFVLISGASGSGKSSLARAGVLPDICNFEVDPSVRMWRRLVIKPSQLGRNPVEGLVTALSARGVLPELEHWKTDIESPPNNEQYREWLSRFRLRFGDALKLAGEKNGATRLVILVDQLEELFSEKEVTENQRKLLFEVLETLARSGQVWILATVRSDFFHQCQTIPALVRMKAGSGQFDLLPPGPDAVSRLITGPALLAGLTFEKEKEVSLSDAILREAAEHKELLPLLEHLLLDLCQHRTSDGMLTFAHFRKVGGVTGALRKRCEDTFNSLSVEAQAVLDRVLGELVTIRGDGKEKYVRQTTLREKFEDKPATHELLDAFVAARLFTMSSGACGKSEVSVAHETLLRAWPRFSDWIERNLEFLRLRAAIQHAKTRWQNGGEDSSLLLAAGLPLEEGHRLLELGKFDVDNELKAFIEQSISMQESKLQRAKFNRHAVIIGLSSLALIAAIGGVIAGAQASLAKKERTYSEKQRKKAELSRDEANRKTLIAENALAETRLQAGRAWLERAVTLTTNETPTEFEKFHASIMASNAIGHRNFGAGSKSPDFQESHANLLVDSKRDFQEAWQIAENCDFFPIWRSPAYGHHNNSITNLEVSPSGGILASVGDGNTIKLWDLTTSVLLDEIFLESAKVTALAFSPSGRSIAYGNSDGMITIWDIESRNAVANFEAHNNSTSRLMFSPDGQLIASFGKFESTIRIWDTSGKFSCVNSFETETTPVCFLGDKELLTLHSNKKVGLQLRDITNFEKLWEYVPHSRTIGSVAVSPTKRHLAMSTTENTSLQIKHSVELLDIATLKARHISSSRSAVNIFLNHKSFSADGKRLLISDRFNTILWDIESERRLRLFDNTSSYAFSDDGQLLLTGGTDGVIRTWDAKKGNSQSSFNSNSVRLTGVKFSPDGAFFVSANQAGRVFIWDSKSGQITKTLNAHSERVSDIEFSPLGDQFATCSDDGSVKLWSIGDQTAILDVRNPKVFIGLENQRMGIKALAFSPDGKHIAGVGTDQVVRVWDAVNGSQVLEKGEYSIEKELAGLGVAYSPNGRLLATAIDNEIKVWDMWDGHKLLKTLDAHEGGVTCLTFNPINGSLLSNGKSEVNGPFISSGKSEIKVWNTSDWSFNSTPFGQSFREIEFSPDGKLLLLTGRSGNTRLVELGVGKGETRVLPSCWNASLGPDKKTL